ncbi:MAG TPA: AI-2E family transporter [Acidimicrobiales bacterium]|nr:AI-2E family transporter [Acidimicrobiales bacterium]
MPVRRTPPGEPASAEPEEEDVSENRRRRILRIADVNSVPVLTILFAVFTVAGVYLAGQLIYHLRDLLLLGVVGGFIALILNPLVVALQHWRVKRRGGAVAIVTFVALLIFMGLAVLFGYPLVNGITHFATALPGYVRSAEHGQGWIGHLFRRYHVERWVTRNSSHLTSLASGLGKPALALGRAALSEVLSLVAVFAFVVLLLIEAPKIRTSLTRLVAPERAKRYRHIGRIISRSVSGYVLGDMLTSLAAGLVVFITLLIFGVPYAFLWALWVALVDFLPTIGGALAGIPTVLFAFAHSLTAGLVTAIVFIVYTQLENHILNPIVMSRTVKINPLLVFVAVLIGANLGAWVAGLAGGFVAVLLSVPMAATIQVIVREWWRASEPE